MKFNKLPLTIDEQITLLKERGMSFKNEAEVKMYLSNISYYRLSAYWYTLLQNPKTEHNFVENTNFSQVLDTYIFDRRLRLLIFDEIERIEIALRTNIIYQFCLEYGNNWYENKSLFRGSDSYFYKFNMILQEEMNKTREVFIQHYREKYTDPANPPAWMALELISFGQLSMLYKNLRNCNARRKVAAHFETLSYVRNTCAHHMRLWNRKLPRTPMLPKNTKYNWLKEISEPNKVNRIYTCLATINYLLSAISPGNSFAKKIKDLLSRYPNLPIQYMGFTPNWSSEKMWNG
jgi:abortive infection bacteriophage resistance protein